MKGPKYRVNITGQEIFCDGKDVWTYDKVRQRSNNHST